MALEYFHEPREQLPRELIDQHRAVASLIEELEAANWYNERRVMANDPELQAILDHNRKEELEHAAMLIEWMRRNMPEFDEQIQTYLNTSGLITELEEQAEGGGEAGGDGGEEAQEGSVSSEGSLNIGSMKKGE
jgi:ferritin-like protein